MFYVYVLESLKSDDIYIGLTNNLKRRLEEHNKGLNSSTKLHAPWKLIYYEVNIERREKYLKTSQGRRLLKRRLKEYFFDN